jgi:hypothetical protein
VIETEGRNTLVLMTISKMEVMMFPWTTDHPALRWSVLILLAVRQTSEGSSHALLR